MKSLEFWGWTYVRFFKYNVMGVALFGEDKRKRILTTSKFGMWTKRLATEVQKETIVENWIQGDLVKSKGAETEIGKRMLTGSITSYHGLQVFFYSRNIMRNDRDTLTFVGLLERNRNTQETLRCGTPVRKLAIMYNERSFSEFSAIGFTCKFWEVSSHAIFWEAGVCCFSGMNNT